MDVEDDIRPTYDSDFSVASTPSASDSESAPEDVDPELIALIPPCFWFPPELPDAGFKWHCPLHGCSHVIDMLDLTPSDARGLPSGEARFLHDKAWHSVRDERVLESFHVMVSRHYENHLGRFGIKLLYKNDNKVRVVFLLFIHVGGLSLMMSGTAAVDTSETTSSMASTETCMRRKCCATSYERTPAINIQQYQKQRYDSKDMSFIEIRMLQALLRC